MNDLVKRADKIIEAINEQTDGLNIWERDMVLLFACEMAKKHVSLDIADMFDDKSEEQS